MLCCAVTFHLPLNKSLGVPCAAPAIHLSLFCYLGPFHDAITFREIGLHYLLYLFCYLLLRQINAPVVPSQCPTCTSVPSSPPFITSLASNGLVIHFQWMPSETMYNRTVPDDLLGRVSVFLTFVGWVLFVPTGQAQIVKHATGHAVNNKTTRCHQCMKVTTSLQKETTVQPLNQQPVSGYDAVTISLRALPQPNQTDHLLCHWSSRVH